MPSCSNIPSKHVHRCHLSIDTLCTFCQGPSCSIQPSLTSPVMKRRTLSTDRVSCSQPSTCPSTPHVPHTGLVRLALSLSSITPSRLLHLPPAARRVLYTMLPRVASLLATALTLPLPCTQLDTARLPHLGVNVVFPDQSSAPVAFCYVGSQNTALTSYALRHVVQHCKDVRAYYAACDMWI